MILPSLFGLVLAHAGTFYLDELDLSNIYQECDRPKKGVNLDGSPFYWNGKRVLRMVGTHAESHFKIDLKQNARSFHTWVGLSPSAGEKGSVAFEVWVDGKLASRSSVMTKRSGLYELNADLRSARTLELKVKNGGDNIDFDHAVWLEPTVELLDPSLVPESVSAVSMPEEQDMSLASKPLIRLNCVFVVCLDDDGKFKPNHFRTAIETREQCREFVRGINEKYKCINVQLVFDGDSYTVRRSTALNRRFHSQLDDPNFKLPESVLTDPAKEPTPTDPEFVRIEKELVKEFPNRAIFTLRDDSLWSFDKQKGCWVVGPTNGGMWANGILHIMGINVPVMVHEFGHMLGLPHTHRTLPASVAEFRKAIEADLAKGRTLEQALAAFDGDGLADTPPNPGLAVATELGFRQFKSDPPYTIPLKGPEGKQQSWSWTPDPYNWMGYYYDHRSYHPKTSRFEGRFSKQQCEVMRKKAEALAAKWHAQ